MICMIFMLRTHATETVDLGSISDRASQHNKNEYFPFSYLPFSIKNKQGKMVERMVEKYNGRKNIMMD